MTCTTVVRCQCVSTDICSSIQVRHANILISYGFVVFEGYAYVMLEPWSSNLQQQLRRPAELVGEDGYPTPLGWQVTCSTNLSLLLAQHNLF